ncbi:hypothetical protein T492DRAFT_946191 [Pavlovales sp. CCMP2436]|nr:hypothetical protein T492DRAFT_946191 [Pavlovales sp. CCMP2436]
MDDGADELSASPGGADGSPECGSPEHGAPERGSPERGSPERGGTERGSTARWSTEFGGPRAWPIPIAPLQELCIQQIAKDIRSYINVPLPAEWHDRLYRILVSSGRLTPQGLLPLLASMSCGDALRAELGASMAKAALGSMGLRALAAANLTHMHSARARERLSASRRLRPEGTIRPQSSALTIEVPRGCSRAEGDTDANLS